MSHIVRKFFMDYEKEEQWLNEMSAQGLALTSYSWCRYVFEESGKGEYIYRIELLEENPKAAKSAEYLQFLEETGAERINANQRAWVNMNWIFLRRKASEGPFTIYSDVDSKIKHYQRIQRLWISLAMMELVIGLINVLMVVLNRGSYISRINLSVGILLIVLSIVFLASSLPVRKKINKLTSDKLIRE